MEMGLGQTNLNSSERSTFAVDILESDPDAQCHIRAAIHVLACAEWSRGYSVASCRVVASICRVDVVGDARLLVGLYKVQVFKVPDLA